MILSSNPGSLFGPENLPYGVFSTSDRGPRVGVRVDDKVLDLTEALGDSMFDTDSLNPFMAQGYDCWVEVRQQIQALLGHQVADNAVHELSDVKMHLPVRIGDFVDFYCSEHHATNLGRLFRPDQAPLTPNWHHLPLSYHGRSGTVVVSGTPIHRPSGQRRDDNTPVFGPSTRLDIECELGFIVGTESTIGHPIPTTDFDQHVFGVVTVNDWSARDIQAWEYVPLGPNLGKSFATTISSWVVPMLALSQARVQTPHQQPKLAYLHMDEPWGLDINFAITWNDTLVSTPPYRSTYWSPAQMLAHMTINGASTRSGDLFASGTVSGPAKTERGSFIELTWGGTQPIHVAGQQRVFLEDGDQVRITATAPGDNNTRIGLGDCNGQIIAAVDTK